MQSGKGSFLPKNTLFFSSRSGRRGMLREMARGLRSGRCYLRESRLLPIPGLSRLLAFRAYGSSYGHLRTKPHPSTSHCLAGDEVPLLCATLPEVVVDNIHGSMADPGAHLSGVCLFPESLMHWEVGIVVTDLSRHSSLSQGRNQRTLIL